MQLDYAKAHDITRFAGEVVRPPRRRKPSEAAASFLRNDRSAWDPAISPMMLEPMDQLASRQYTGIIFVGPARSSKTFSLILGGLTYIVTSAPGDMLVIQMSQEASRDFSRNELDRCLRYSPELAARISTKARHDNLFDKHFRSGVSLKLGWPAVSQLSSKTLQYVFLTDYDRPENRDDVDGEGPMWDLAQKRTQTYMSRGKCLAESSPAEEMVEGNWVAATPHEAPPVPGILSLYNRGTRARWYWPCLHCGAFFQVRPGIDIFGLPKFEELEAIVRTADLMSYAEEHARIVCVECGGVHQMKDRPELNRRGVWLHEGESIDARSKAVSGERRRSVIASYWLGGAAATYQRWDSLLAKYLQGIATYVHTGEEQALKSMVNTDLAAPYLSRAQAKRRVAEAYRGRVEKYTSGMVPAAARFLTAAVDVQAHRFAVHVIAWGPHLESWLVDRFSITGSQRPEGDQRMAALDPSSYAEDWQVLVADVIERKFPVEGKATHLLAPQMTVCDSGGRDGVTQRAYEFWRSLKAKGMTQRFQLVKGDGRLNIPRVQQTWPDSRGRGDRRSFARGDVPVWLLNVNQLKDGVVNDLGREEPGPGFVHFPDWADLDYFRELCAEVRTGKGWLSPRGQRNEAWDLHVYARAACIILRAEHIDWNAPPSWAAPLDGRATELAGGETQSKRDRIAALSRGLNG